MQQCSLFSSIHLRSVPASKGSHRFTACPLPLSLCVCLSLFLSPSFFLSLSLLPRSWRGCDSEGIVSPLLLSFSLSKSNYIFICPFLICSPSLSRTRSHLGIGENFHTGMRGLLRISIFLPMFVLCFCS